MVSKHRTFNLCVLYLYEDRGWRGTAGVGPQGELWGGGARRDSLVLVGVVGVHGSLTLRLLQQSEHNLKFYLG